MIIKNRRLTNFAKLVESGECRKFTGELRVGVDLGTSNTVLAVVDKTNKPVAGITAPSHAIQDGVIVNYRDCVKVVEKLKAELEERLGVELKYAAAAIPPGVSKGSIKAIGHVVEDAGFQICNIVDEPTAAAAVFDIKDGAVVDVGGGTTGVSIIKDGKIIYTDDEATGGTHMTHTVAGHFKIPYEEAEVFKIDKKNEKEVFPVIKAVVEKMASITKKFIEGHDVPAVYVAGGSSNFEDFSQVFENWIKIPVHKPEHPLLVTPLGIAYLCEIPEEEKKENKESK